MTFSGPAVRDVLLPKIRERLGPEADGLRDSAMGLLERMVTVGASVVVDRSPQTPEE